jgi:putative ABC transport system permease protein
MAIPLNYNLRNLVVRKTTTVMTALGIALTVSVLLAILAMVDGLRATLATSGDPLNVLVLRKGSASEIVSNFERTQFQDLKFKRGIATGRDGQPLASLELVTVINLGAGQGTEGTNVAVRGLLPVGIEMRRGVHITSGRWFEQGKREVVVGKAIATRFAGTGIGGKVNFGRRDWDIVGVFDAGNGSQGSEVWGDLNQIAADLQRTDVLSSALVVAADEVAAKALVNDINNDQRLNMSAQSEKDYYEAQTTNAEPIQIIGVFVAIVMAVGSSFAAMNTMYAAVARRAREIGTLRVLGFSRGSILLSFFVESILLSVLGGVLGCLLVVWLNGATTTIGNANFAETSFNFHLSPQLMLGGIAFGLVMGCLGGLFPARSAARKEILTALREV